MMRVSEPSFRRRRAMCLSLALFEMWAMIRRTMERTNSNRVRKSTMLKLFKKPEFTDISDRMEGRLEVYWERETDSPLNKPNFVKGKE